MSRVNSARGGSATTAGVANAVRNRSADSGRMGMAPGRAGRRSYHAAPGRALPINPSCAACPARLYPPVPVGGPGRPRPLRQGRRMSRSLVPVAFVLALSATVLGQDPVERALGVQQALAAAEKPTSPPSRADASQVPSATRRRSRPVPRRPPTGLRRRAEATRTHPERRARRRARPAAGAARCRSDHARRGHVARRAGRCRTGARTRVSALFNRKYAPGRGEVRGARRGATRR